MSGLKTAEAVGRDMRALPLAIAGFLVLALVPTVAAILPTCNDASSTTSVNFTWTPGCVRIVSGAIVTFGNADTSMHNARSSQDDNAVLRLLAPLCFQTANLGQGGNAQVRFTHDSNGVTASLRNADGSWGPVVDCDLAEDITTLATDEAAIPFECGIHQTMTGTIRIRMLG